MKVLRLLAAVGLILAFGTAAVAAEYYVVKDQSGKLTIVESKPSDEKIIVKGPFKVRSEAEAIVTESGATATTVVPGPPAAGVTGTAPAAPARPAAPPAPPVPAPPAAR